MALPLKDIAFIHKNFEEKDYRKINGRIENLPAKDYLVVRVADFLVKLYGKEIAPYLKLLPQSTLEGLVNASHFQNLSNTDFEGERRVINGDLLKLGLTRQCAFGLPADYSGITGIIPVCLPSKNGKPVYTFIVIKVKPKKGSIDFDDALEMQAKLHFVQCEHAANEAVDDRHVCSTPEDLHEIYGNQIALVFSFEEAAKGTSSSNGVSVHQEALNELYDAERLESFKAAISDNLAPEFTLNKIPDSESIRGPRIKHQIEVNPAISILSCLWDDDKDSIPSAPKKTKIEEQKSGRQRIFCIASTGIDILQRLLPNSEDRERAKALLEKELNDNKTQ